MTANKTVSLEMARMLKESGWNKVCENKEIWDEWGIIYKPTTDELLEELPFKIIKKKITYFLNIETALDSQFAVNYVSFDMELLNPRSFREQLCMACSDTWLYLKKEALL